MSKNATVKTRRNRRRFLILTVEPLSNPVRNHRLSLMRQDYHEFTQLIAGSSRVIVQLGNNNVDCTGAIGVYRRHGRLVSVLLSNWIHANQLSLTPPGNPAKIIFELKITSTIHRYILYPQQMNLLCRAIRIKLRKS